MGISSAIFIIQHWLPMELCDIFEYSTRRDYWPLYTNICVHAILECKLYRYPQRWQHMHAQPDECHNVHSVIYVMHACHMLQTRRVFHTLTLNNTTIYTVYFLIIRTPY